MPDRNPSIHDRPDQGPWRGIRRPIPDPKGFWPVVGVADGRARGSKPCRRQGTGKGDSVNSADMAGGNGTRPHTYSPPPFIQSVSNR